MGLISLEHGKLAYQADFAFYGAAVAGLSAFLLIAAPDQKRLEIVLLAIAGLVSWTFIEYSLHRFLLHSIQPFRGWHEAHHQRPMALICTPTIMSASLFAVLIFMPVFLLGNLWLACAFTLGALTGYLAYGITHHATHHWQGKSAWLKQRKRCHALHHHLETPGYYGVTCAFWDHIFGSVNRSNPAAAPTAK